MRKAKIFKIEVVNASAVSNRIIWGLKLKMSTASSAKLSAIDRRFLGLYVLGIIFFLAWRRVLEGLGLKICWLFSQKEKKVRLCKPAWLLKNDNIKINIKIENEIIYLKIKNSDKRRGDEM